MESEIKTRLEQYRRDNIRELNANDLKLTNLDEFNEALQNAKRVSIIRNQIRTLGQSLLGVEITYIDISCNKISSLDGLQNAKKLNTLIASQNEIEDLKALSELTELRILRLGCNRIESVEQLEPLKDLHLEELSLWEPLVLVAGYNCS